MRKRSRAPLVPLVLILLSVASVTHGFVPSPVKTGDRIPDEAAEILFGAFAIVAVAVLILVVLVTAGTWRVFEKAGQPGWAALVPVYSWIVLLRVVRKPEWWVLLMLVPFMNIGVFVVISIDLARAFGMEEIFAVGLILLPWAFYPILGFGDSAYVYGTGDRQDPEYGGISGGTDQYT
jgi:hypothetical protein